MGEQINKFYTGFDYTGTRGNNNNNEGFPTPGYIFRLFFDQICNWRKKKLGPIYSPIIFPIWLKYHKEKLSKKKNCCFT